ncbi:FMN-binding negative transcriptional regulator [Chitinophaga rhizosphaerae]|uniref:FMN-binding negative transcriptional regulator n=1 Tax=Chitinophaga rhizosphaerae TaxID=1864947 RepID=UPI000F804E4F|nr:FMN-binding negative transcriptional regulator [Chitinophaga rhizosphaerae]
MYTPKQTQEHDFETIAAFIRKHAFALLLSVRDGAPYGTHIPVELEEREPGTFVLRGHLANANPQTEDFKSGQTFLAVFTDPHAYISSSWYEKEKIPTWNYIAVHIYGKLRILSETELVDSLTSLMNKYEASSEHPVRMADVPEKAMQASLKAITGFEMSLDKIETRFKLSQNRSDRDYANIISHLNASGDSQAAEIAEEMAKRRQAGQ